MNLFKPTKYLGETPCNKVTRLGLKKEHTKNKYRNRPCPCNSGSKFKDCCQPTLIRYLEI